MRNFKLRESSEANFKKLEKVIPRMAKRLGVKTFSLIPASVITAYKSEIDPDGLIFRACLFSGTVKKVAFRIMEIDGKATPKYICSIYSGSEIRTFNFSTKRFGHTQELNVKVSDGDYVEVKQLPVTTQATCTLKDIHIAVLMSIDQKEAEVKSHLTNELLNETEYEGI